MKHQWNTGRQYTEHGQRIIAQVVDDPGRRGIIFRDIDRGIDGYIHLFNLPETRPELLLVTMFNYDHCNYRSDPHLALDVDTPKARELRWEETCPT